MKKFHLGLAIALVMALVLPVAAFAAPQATFTKTIWAGALDDHDCDATEWHFVITQVFFGQSWSPSSITVNFANGSSVVVPRTSFTGFTAHYTTTAHLDSTVTSASATIYSLWSGQFRLSHGPCPPPPPPPVEGCTDPLASNYNPEATVDDGSCEFPPPLVVCEDEQALNYGEEGECEYPPPLVCEDPIAVNFGEPGECMYELCEWDEMIFAHDPECVPPPPPPAPRPTPRPCVIIEGDLDTPWEAAEILFGDGRRYMELTVNGVPYQEGQDLYNGDEVCKGRAPSTGGGFDAIPLVGLSLLTAIGAGAFILNKRRTS